MNSYQKYLLAIFLPVTLLIITLDYIYPSQFFVDIIKFTAMAALLLASLYIKKHYDEQLLLLLSIFFAVLGDLFFVLLERFLSFSWSMGIVCFTISYCFLTAVFSKKNPHHSVVSILTAIPVLSLVIPVAYLAYHQTSQRILPFGIIFMLILSCMTWSAIKTLFGCYYSSGSSKLMAAAGLLILICDTSVILSAFGPPCPHYFKIILKSITWAAWIPAWTLISVLIAEDNLLSEK